MRVLIVTGEFPPRQGGIADYTANLADHLAGCGIEIIVLTSPAPAGRASSSEHQAFQILPTVKNWGFGCWRKIKDVARSHRVDLVHLQYQAAMYDLHPAIHLLPWWLHRRMDIAIAMTLHDFSVPYLFPKAGSLRDVTLRLLIRGCDGVIATNLEDLARLAEIHPPSRRFHIPIGSNVYPRPPEAYDRAAWRDRLGIDPNELLIAYFGLLNHSKGVPTLLEALRLLLDVGRPAHLLMIGAGVGDSDPTNAIYREEIKREIEQLQVESHVTWTGQGTLEAISGHLLAADVAALCFKDGASFRRTTLLAALAHGLPVLTTYRPDGSPADGLNDGINCRLVPPCLPEATERILAELADDPALRARLSKGGRILAMQFEWSAIAEKTIRAYREILAHTR